MTAASSHEDRIVAEVLAALGPWANEVVIGGGFAPIIYRLYIASGDVGKGGGLKRLKPQRIKAQRRSCRYTIG